MRNFALVAGLSLGLTGCFGPGDPINIPKDAIEAAKTCFAVQTLALRADKGADDPVTYDQFSKTVQYPMMAAAQTDPFEVETVMTVLTGAAVEMDQLGSMDYMGAVPACEARFEIDGAGADPKLPETDSDALLSCATIAAFMGGTMDEGGAGFGDRAKTVQALAARLQKQVESNPDILVLMIQNQDDGFMEKALQSAFREGNPDAYLNKCDARFPVE